MTDNATQALEILASGSAHLQNAAAITDADDPTFRAYLELATATHQAANVYALLAIADAIRETGQRGECRSESLRRAHETCIRPAGHDGRHQGTHGSIW